ncbi:MAG TPA: hypothetical protein ENH10_05865, partial [Bacteroidetes bacterium]|nr:hypothetical protein [Bacteroidota bacterium]HEX04670.1 hypothetical protein [Bacteroidota bacterium]
MNKILKAILLWVLALVLTLTALVYQRLTGPTYPVSGEATVAGELIEYELLRSHARNVDPDYGMDHVVRIPISNPDINGTMFWKRLGIDEPFTEVSMTRD